MFYIHTATRFLVTAVYFNSVLVLRDSQTELDKDTVFSTQYYGSLSQN